MTPGKRHSAFSQRQRRSVLEIRRVGERMIIRLESVILLTFSWIRMGC